MCNVPGHYGAGMWTEFTVNPQGMMWPLLTVRLAGGAFTSLRHDPGHPAWCTLRDLSEPIGTPRVVLAHLILQNR
nr:hypothetical protein [Mesorhizobium kowhaii]